MVRASDGFLLFAFPLSGEVYYDRNLLTEWVPQQLAGIQFRVSMFYTALFIIDALDARQNAREILFERGALSSSGSQYGRFASIRSNSALKPVPKTARRIPV